MMLYGTLISYTGKTQFYKGDMYNRNTLIFQIYFLGIKIFKKTVTYDLTMFNDFKLYQDYWNCLIISKSKIKYSIIKDQQIF